MKQRVTERAQKRACQSESKGSDAGRGWPVLRGLCDWSLVIKTSGVRSCKAQWVSVRSLDFILHVMESC